MLSNTSGNRRTVLSPLSIDDVLDLLEGLALEEARGHYAIKKAAASASRFSGARMRGLLQGVVARGLAAEVDPGRWMLTVEGLSHREAARRLRSQLFSDPDQ